MNKKVGMKLENVTGGNITPEIDEEKIQRMFGEQEGLLKFLSEFEVDEEVFAKVVLERDALKFLFHEYKDLEEQGLLLRLPCKIGDTCYRINKGNYNSNWKPFVQELEVTEIRTKRERKNGEKIVAMGIVAGGIRYLLENIGKTVFLTREEAEAKLKEMER